MKKLYVGQALTLVLAGCALHPTIRYPEQATKKAKYYETEAAAVKKQVKRQNHVIERLREQIEEAKAARRHYEERSKSARDRLHELRSQTPAGQAEREALSLLEREWQTRVDHMEVSADDQETMVDFLQDQLRMQRNFRDDLEERARQMRKQAHQMRELASEMKARNQNKDSSSGQ